MSVIGSNILAGASGQGAGGYNLTNSLRFRSSASAYLNRTPTSDSNRKTWTWSGWVKRGALGDGIIQELFCAGLVSGTNFHTRICLLDNTLYFVNYPNGTPLGNLVSAQVFRDYSSWYHFVVAVDTTQATDSNRVKMYVNGSQITSLSTATYPPQNQDTMINTTSYTNFIGKFVPGSSANYFDGYMAEMHFIDGQALTPSSFGETNSKTGAWQPIEYAGTYGTNGFYLPFTDNSALTTSSNVGLGKDFSGNGNYWTTNNISITSGATYDSMTDVPTLTSATASNFATLNPLAQRASYPTTFSNANLQCAFPNASFYQNTIGTIGVTNGKFYWEVTVSATGASDGTRIGISNDLSQNSAGTATVYRTYINDGTKNDQVAGPASYGASYTTNDVIGVALDITAGTITFYKNNTSQGTAFTDIASALPSSGWFPYFQGTNGSTLISNFGQRPFAYTPPTGFVALNTYNLPTPTIGATASSQANKYFDATLYTGNGSTQSVVNAGGFQPDLVRIKTRVAVSGHSLTDSVRGVMKSLQSNTTGSEDSTSPYGVTAFNSNGFSLNDTSSGAYGVNGASGGTYSGTPPNYVAWQWRASNATGVTNTAGSITSTVSANTTSGFSIVTYTGNGSAGATVGHGLGVAPKMIIIKSRSLGGTVSPVYHASIGNTGSVWLNSTNSTDIGSYYWNNTTPTSTVFTLGYDGSLNDSGATYVAYCFSEVAGFSKFGSYTGNGSADGPMIFTGFKPKYVLIKARSTTGGWNVVDSARSPSNVVDDVLFPNLSDAEGTFNWLDFTSNGFKIRNTLAGSNTSGTTYIYMAFAEVPSKYALGV